MAKIVDVYRGVMFNALARIEEDEAGPAGSLGGGKAEDKGVRVSLFTATLGISPYAFMREVRPASGWKASMRLTEYKKAHLHGNEMRQKE